GESDHAGDRREESTLHGTVLRKLSSPFEEYVSAPIFVGHFAQIDGRLDYIKARTQHAPAESSRDLLRVREVHRRRASRRVVKLSCHCWRRGRDSARALRDRAENLWRPMRRSPSPSARAPTRSIRCTRKKHARWFLSRASARSHFRRAEEADPFVRAMPRRDRARARSPLART